MKGTEIFKQTIQNYLQVRANADELFAKDFAKENKNIDECCNYVINRAYEMERNGFVDDEVYGLAVHYYNEDDIDPKYLKDNTNLERVVVNHEPTISEITHEVFAERKEEAERKSIPLYTPSRPKAKKNESDNQLSLF